MTANEGWRLLALAELAVILVAAYHIQHGEVMVLSRHKLKVEITSAMMTGYLDGRTYCANQKGAR